MYGFSYVTVGKGRLYLDLRFLTVSKPSPLCSANFIASKTNIILGFLLKDGALKFLIDSKLIGLGGNPGDFMIISSSLMIKYIGAPSIA